MSIEMKLKEMETKIVEIGKAPILFVGSGISRRYYDTPDWEALLKAVATRIGFDGNEIKKWGTNENIATELEYHCFSKYQPDYKNGEDRRYPLRKIIKEIIEQKKEILTEKEGEVSCLGNITPTAIVTTNYDELLENVFEKKAFSICVGQDIILSNNNSGTIYKIHGSISDLSSIVITQEDYDRFMSHSKYLYAKLMTLFWEYPIVFMGYSINDANVKDILDTMLDVMSEEQKKDFEQRVWILARAEEKEYFKEEERSVGKNCSKTKTFYLDKSYQRFYEALSAATDEILEKNLKFIISEKAIDLLIEPLYQKQDKFRVVVRELLQNATDACKKLNNQVQVIVAVETDDNNVTLRVSDCGIGMDWTDVKEYFLTIGKSSKDEQNEGLTGKFGIGILSIFLIGSEAKVYSKKGLSTTIGLCIHEIDDEKKVEKIAADDKKLIKGSGTTIELVIKDEMIVNSVKNAGRIDNVLNILGLENYYVWENSQIEVLFNGEKKNIEKFNYEITEKINENLYIEKIYDDNNEKQKHAKKTALINDMIVRVSFDKGNGSMVKDDDIPFFAVRTKQKLYCNDVVPNLERSVVGIRGELKNDIVKYVYKEEIDNFINVLRQQLKIQVHLRAYDICNIISGCKLLKNRDFIYMDSAVVIPNSDKFVTKIYGSFDFFKEYVGKVRCSYNVGGSNKGDLGDMIVEGSVKGIGSYYLDKYIYRASGSYNGFRMQVIHNLFDKIGIDYITYDNATSMWSKIIENREKLKEHWENRMENSILWLDAEYQTELTSSAKYDTVVISCEFVHTIDTSFIQMLKNEIVKEENNDISQYIFFE